jgi:hypothetical protein
MEDRTDNQNDSLQGEPAVMLLDALPGLIDYGTAWPTSREGSHCQPKHETLSHFQIFPSGTSSARHSYASLSSLARPETHESLLSSCSMWGAIDSSTKLSWG